MTSFLSFVPCGSRKNHKMWGAWTRGGGTSLSVSGKFSFYAQNVPAYLVLGGIFLIVIGVLLDAASNGLGNGAIAIGFILLVVGVAIWAYDRWS